MCAPPGFSCVVRWLVCLLAVSGLGTGMAAPVPPPHPPATYWVDNDSTPWLRELRRQSNTHDVAFWQQQLRAHPRPDTIRVVMLARLADAQEVSDARADRATRLAALRLAYQLPYFQIRAETQLALASYHTQLAQYDSATQYLAAAEQQFRLDHNAGGVIRCLTQLARIADQQGHYAASLGYSYQALALPLIGNTRRFNTSIKIQLATTYAQVGDYPEARRYLLEALRIAAEQDYPDRTNLALGELGEVCRRQRQWGPARQYFLRSIAVSRQIDNLPYTLAMRLNLGRLAEDQGQLTAAIAAGQQVLVRAQAAHLPLLVAQAQALLARLALRQGQLAAAIAYGRQSLAGSQQARLLAGTAEASAVLADAYTRQRAYGPALAALRQYTAAHDSLLGDVARRRAALLQFGQQQRAQQARIVQLTQQNRLQGQAQELTRLRSQREVIGLGALTLLALLLAGSVLWQYRRRQARREARLRTQIAADLHDDVGTLLSQISMQSDVLQAGLASPAGQHRQLSQIAEASRSAMRQLNDVVWSLDAHNDHLTDLLDRLRDYAHEVLGPAGLPVAFDAPATLPTARLPITLRRHLYLIYKEALHNVLRHAPPASPVLVRLHLESSPARLVLEVCNEAPPTPAPAGSPARRTGHGLRNITERATALGGSATCGPRPEGGFRVWVRVPLAE